MNLERVLGGSGRVRVLRALFSRDGVSGRNVSARARVSPSSGKAALDELAALGIVLKVPSGKRHVYELNRSHVFTSLLGELFAAERGYLARVARRLERMMRPAPGGGLRAIGVSEEGQVTLLLAPPLPAERKVHRKIDRLLWFSFGLRLSAVTTDPDEMRGMAHVWTAAPGGVRPADQDIKELIRFFDFTE